MTAEAAILEAYGVPTFAELLGVRRVEELDSSPPPPLFSGLLVEDELTIVYGPGGKGKGVLMASVLLEASRAGRKALVLDYEGHRREYAVRCRGLGVVGPYYLAPLAHPRLAGPITAHAETVRDLCDELEVDLLVVDSLAYALPGLDVAESTSATAFTAAVKRIGRTTVATAHTTKASDPWPAYPFGSVFWHNSARATWALEQVDDDPHTVELRNRKASEHGPQAPRRYVITWEDGVLAAVTGEPIGRPFVDRIDDALATGPLSILDVTLALNADGGERTDTKRVGALLRKYEVRGRYERDPGPGVRYRIAGRAE